MRRQQLGRWAWVVVPLLCTQFGDAASASPGIEVVSSRPDMVSGGATLVQLNLPAGGAPLYRVALNGRNVTAAFRASPDGAILGLVSGLPDGQSTLTLSAAGQHAKLIVQNHRITGPLFSGLPQQPLLACATEEAGLGKALDANCSAVTKVEYLYRSTQGSTPMVFDMAHPLRQAEDFKPYDPSAARPADMATVTDADGKTVDFIVRRERGTINRAIYEIEFRHIPGTPLPDPWTHTPSWNGKLIYEFGGPCSAAYAQQWYLQPLYRAQAMAAGYAVATSTLNVFGNDCNDVRSAETLSMVKEKFIKAFGIPVFTIGRGYSGGSMQQYLIAQNYPGLLDGIVPANNFPDWWTLYPEVADCLVLAGAIDSSKLPWSDEQRRAVSGMAKWTFCQSSSRMPWLKPAACLASVPKDKIYDPTSNPGGIRCTIEDNMIEQVGTDPVTGHARRPYDNVGIQYGLKAFSEGVITADQFISLNESAGGIDSDGARIPSRSSIDRDTLRAYYRKGRVNTAAGDLAAIPIIDNRAYTDPWGDVHDFSKSFAVRARLVPINGARNHVIWVAGGDVKDPNIFTATSKASGLVNVKAVETMDAWLAALKADHSSRSAIDKVVAAKPAEAVDACFAADAGRITDSAKCDELFPHFGSPRQAAGGPVADDVLKCQLRPLDRSSYPRALSDDEWARLQAVFPLGVCDYSRPPEGYEQPEGTWLRY